MLRVDVRVQPAASRDELWFDGTELRMRITASAVDGRANERVIALLAKQLGLPKRAVRIVRGQRSRQKLLEIDSLDLAELHQRIGPR